MRLIVRVRFRIFTIVVLFSVRTVYLAFCRIACIFPKSATQLPSLIISAQNYTIPANRHSQIITTLTEGTSRDTVIDAHQGRPQPLAAVAAARRLGLLTQGVLSSSEC